MSLFAFLLFDTKNHQNRGFNFLDVRNFEVFAPQANTAFSPSKFVAITAFLLQYLAALAAKYLKKIQKIAFLNNVVDLYSGAPMGHTA